MLTKSEKKILEQRRWARQFYTDEVQADVPGGSARDHDQPRGGTMTENRWVQDLSTRGGGGGFHPVLPSLEVVYRTDPDALAAGTVARGYSRPYFGMAPEKACSYSP